MLGNFKNDYQKQIIILVLASQHFGRNCYNSFFLLKFFDLIVDWSESSRRYKLFTICKRYIVVVRKILKVKLFKESAYENSAC
jgi:hypothetical protein